MVKKIGKPDLLEKLRERYNTEEYTSEVFALIEKAILTVNLDDLAKNLVCARTSFATTSSGNSANLHVCPKGERRKILAIAVFPDTGSATIQHLEFRDASEAVWMPLLYGLTPVTTITMPATYGLNPFVMEEGDYLRVNIVVVGTSSIIAIMYEKEDVH